VLPGLTDRTESPTRTLVPVTVDGRDAWLRGLPESGARWVEAAGFKATPGSVVMLPPDTDGAEPAWAAGVGDDFWGFAALPAVLPPGRYGLTAVDGPTATRAAIGWALGSWRFERYCAAGEAAPLLVWSEAADRAVVERIAGAILLVRDLVTTPANDLGPAELAAVAGTIAAAHGAAMQIVVGDDLLVRNYPMIHAVGRASTRAPRLIDLRWGDPAAPKLTLVGKGVCFDSGGLDVKTASGMLIMKKDMGGAAHALALAGMIMDARLPVRLRVLVPAVENAVSGDSFRPLDVLPSRRGLSVEIGNTDAEGRLVLADALAEASAERPDLLIDFATLTGAARVALGPDLPAMFCNDEATAAGLLAAAERVEDPLWRLPLWPGYAKQLKSAVADLNSAPDWNFAGSIVAALFLERFVDAGIPWIHLDLFAWNATDRPGRPKGGEAMALRAAFALIEERFGGAR
jgi:leucyl aminopeptidase